MGRSRPSCSSRSIGAFPAFGVVRVQLFSTRPVPDSLQPAPGRSPPPGPDGLARRPAAHALEQPARRRAGGARDAARLPLARALPARAARVARRCRRGRAGVLRHAGSRADAPLLRRRPGERRGAARGRPLGAALADASRSTSCSRSPVSACSCSRFARGRGCGRWRRCSPSPSSRSTRRGAACG